MTTRREHDPFFDVPQETVSTSTGDVELPIHYHDGFVGTALFAVPLEAAATLLHGTPLMPLNHHGTATAAVTFYDYRDTSIGPYQEVALALAVTLQDATAPGFYILDLPVTTPRAEAAGRELWGYPKFVANISIDRANNNYRGILRDAGTREEQAPTKERTRRNEGQIILKLAGEPGPIEKDSVAGQDIVTYSTLSKPSASHPATPQLLRTTIPTDCRYTVHRSGSLTLTIGDSDHPMTGRLCELGLEDATPLCWQTTDAFRSRLSRGVEA